MLTTVEALKKQLNIPMEDNSQDAELDRLIKSVSAAIENYCQRKFKQNEYTDTLQPTFTPELVVKNYPIVSVVSLEHGGEPLAPEEYTFREGAFYKTIGTWNDEVKVTYKAGYILPGDEDTEADPPVIRTLPYDLEDACILWCTYRYQMGNSMGVSSERIDGLGQKNYALQHVNGKVLPAPPAVLALIDPYRCLIV